MIDICLPHGNNYVVLALSLISLATFLTWIVMLATTVAARTWLRGHRTVGAIGLLALAGVGALFPLLHIPHWLRTRQMETRHEAHSLTLAADTVVDNIPMPAGTHLLVSQEGHAETYQHAVFPTPTDVAGIRSLSIHRYLDQPNAQSENLSVIAARDSRVDSWICSRRHPIELHVDDTGATSLNSCSLGVGVSVDDTVLPLGTWVTNHVSLSPLQAVAPQARWLLDIEGSTPVRISGLPLLSVTILVDVHHHVLAFSGQTNATVKLGSITYPAGTAVRTPGRDVPQARLRDMVLTPARGTVATQDDGKPLPDGDSVLQSPDGTVRSFLIGHDPSATIHSTIQSSP